MLHILDLPTELLLHICTHLLPAPSSSSSSAADAASSSPPSSSHPSYAHFRAYLALRHTCRTLHTLLPLPTYTTLLAHALVFEDAGWLPCEKCVRMRPRNYFFGGVGHDGIGPYLISSPRSSRLAPPPRTCIDCSPHGHRTRFYFTPLSSSSAAAARSSRPDTAVTVTASTSRATNNGQGGPSTSTNTNTSGSGRMYCICDCCGWLGRSSLNMQVCAACFDEDFGGDVAPSECHRRRFQMLGSGRESGVKGGGGGGTGRNRGGDSFGDILRAEEEKRVAVAVVRNRGAAGGEAGGQGGGGSEGAPAWERMQFGLGTFLGGNGG